MSSSLNIEGRKNKEIDDKYRALAKQCNELKVELPKEVEDYLYDGGRLNIKEATKPLDYAYGYELDIKMLTLLGVETLIVKYD